MRTQVEAGEYEIDLRRMSVFLWRGKWLILPLMLLTALAGGALSLLMPPRYEASVLVMPLSGSANSGGRMGGASQVSGLASLVGISLDGGSDKSESIAVLQSEALTQRYIQENNLLPTLFPKNWDVVSGKWKTEAPSLWRANETFKKIRRITDDKKTGLYTLTITWADPMAAARWANDLVRLTNEYLREKAISESERRIAYLNEQAEKTSITQVRTAIYGILESEIKSIMLARGTNEYALKVIDPAVPPERDLSKTRVLFSVVGAFFGLLISLVILLVKQQRSADRQPS